MPEAVINSRSMMTSMAHSNTLTRDKFLTEFESLAGQFSRKQQEVSATEDAFFSNLGGLRNVAESDPLTSSTLDVNHPLRTLLQERVNEVQRVFSFWDERIANRETHAEFKERTADSLLVFVYGKVKAGKSSLGNYIAWGQAQPTEQDQLDGRKKPEFFLEKSCDLTELVSDDSIRKARKFKVGEAETTSAIQGFKLPGLTWIDSPGLHSKNSENGDLALQYVDAADLILYLTNSSAPCKRSDLQELQDLGRKEHNLAVIITGSDMFDEDEDENGELIKIRQMKSSSDREAQLKYVRDSLIQQGDCDNSEVARKIDRTLRRAQVHSVSVAYAAEHPDSTGMELSGIGKMLYEVSILAKGEGVRAKLVQPLKNLRSFLDEIQTTDLKKIQQCLGDVSLAVGKARTQADMDARQSLQKIELEIGPAVDALLRRHSKDSKAFKHSLNEAYKKWMGQANEAIAQAYAASLGQGLNLAMDDAIGAIPEFAPMTKSFKRQKSINAKRGTALGALAGAISLLVPGGILVAGAVGLAAAMIGGVAGNKLGGMLDTEEDLEVVVGDNSLEVAASARKQLRELFKVKTTRLLVGIDDICFNALMSWVSALDTQIMSVNDKTMRLIEELDDRIEKA